MVKDNKNVKKYVKEYNLCQRIKNKIKELAEKLKLSEGLEVAGKNAILVVCNQLSKITHFVTTIKRTLAKGLMRLFKDNV